MATGRTLSSRSRHGRQRTSHKKIRVNELHVLELTGVEEDHSASSGMHFSKKKRGEVEISENPLIVWEGGLRAFVDFEGCRFSVKERSISSGRSIWVVYLVYAAQETGLSEIAGTNIYITVGQLRAPKFQSPLVEHSEGWEIQKKIWMFLHSFFVERGIKYVPVLMPSGVIVPDPSLALTISDSRKGLLWGSPGLYSFEDVFPRAVFRVGNLAPPSSALVIELVSVDEGHELSGRSQSGTKIYHSVLVRALAYRFKGPRAKDMEEMWLFLLSTVAP